MSIMTGIRKAMESADSGLQELIDEVVTHADELEEDASERMYAGMYGEDDSADISSADIDDDDDDSEVPVTQSDADPETDEEDEPMLLKQRNELEAEDALESLLKALESDCCESDECEDSDDDDDHLSDDLGEDTPDAAGMDGYPDPDEAHEECDSSLESLINSISDPWMSVANEACDCPADSGCRIADVSDAEDMEPGDKDDEDKVDPADPDETVTRDDLHPDGETTSLESLLASLAMESDSKDDDDDKSCDDDESDDDDKKSSKKSNDDDDDSDDDDDKDDDDSDDEDDDDKEESAEESLLSLLNSL